MDNNKIITISRQFGSGGKEIGARLSEALGIPLYDKEYVSHAVKEYGLYQEAIADVVKNPTESLLFSLVSNMYPLTRNGVSMEAQLMEAEISALRNLAKEGSCVFVGRSAELVFSDNPDCISIFISAPLEVRIPRIMEIFSITEQKAKSLIRQTDKKRAAYFSSHAVDGYWGKPGHYDLCVDSSRLGLDGTANYLLQALNILA